MSSDTRPSARWAALPRLLETAPPRVVLIVGIAVAVLGALIATRPLTSVVVLGLYVALSAIVTGLVGLAAAQRAPRWWSRAAALAWIAGGLVVLVFLGQGLQFLPPVLAVLLVVGGLASLGDAITRGRVSQRVLALAWGVAQIVFGVLSRSWPDVTVIVVAVAFGVRTFVLGAALVGRAVRGMRASARGRRVRPPEPAAALRRLTGAALARYALTAVLVVLTAGSWWVADWLDDGAPVIDAFYDPPADVPDGHGILLRWDDYLGRQPQNGDVRRILYTTRDAVGDAAVASALVILPRDAPPGPRPVVIWNHGTTGVAQGCAPSLQDSSATRFAIPALEQALAAGWVVVASDYAGQGAPGDFPYLIGRGEARSSLDAVLAAAQLPALTLSPDTVVWGHSQGGHAALWTARLAPQYTPGIDVRGTVAVAPAADPLALADALLTEDDDALLSVMISWVLVPYDDTYDDVELADYVTPGGRTIVREMAQRCVSEPGVIVSVLAALGVSEDRPLYTGDLTSGALGRRLAENSAAAPIGSPLMVVWGGRDEVIPASVQERFVRSMCDQGQPLRWVELAEEDHIGPVWPGRPVIPAMFRWSQGLLERTPVQLDRCAEVPPSW